MKSQIERVRDGGYKEQEWPEGERYEGWMERREEVGGEGKESEYWEKENV